MQEGSFRCDANVSVRPIGQKELGTRTELKNINSFRFVEKAINVEVKRQIKLLESGEKVTQETRLYDSDKNETRAMRSKEEANDYRYFPDPDLLPVVIDQSYIDNERQFIPEFPAAKQARYIAELGLKEEDAKIIANDKELSGLFDETISLQKQSTPQMCANMLLGEYSSLLKADDGNSDKPVSSAQFSNLLENLAAGKISHKIAKVILEKIWNTEISADEIIEKESLAQVSDSGELDQIIKTLVENNPSQFDEYKQGNMKMFNFFVGQVMKQTKGRANPAQVKSILENF